MIATEVDGTETGTRTGGQAAEEAHLTPGVGTDGLTEEAGAEAIIVRSCVSHH